MKIAYIGHKPVKSDNVAGTGLVWQGYGDVRYVTVEAARKLLAFPGVWVVAGDATLVTHRKDGQLSINDGPHTQPKAPIGRDFDPAEPAAANDKAGMLAVAHSLGIDIDGRSSIAKIAAAIDAARQG